MINVLIGHRGCGKTALLKRVKIYAEAANVEALTFDLDEVIAQQEGLTVDEIFKSQGEESFRRLEIGVFKKLIEQIGKSSAWISVGAGFQGEIPKQIKVWWVRRTSDQTGRIFLDRPRLNPELSPLDEFFARAAFREQRFRDRADVQILLSEGFLRANSVESRLLGFQRVDAGGYVTLLPESLTNARLAHTIQRLHSFKPSRIELRDDLLDDATLRQIAEHLDPSLALFSLRKTKTVPTEWRSSAIDWALELGTAPNSLEPMVLSQHERGDNLSALLKSLPHSAPILKLAVPIANFKELQQGHEWFLENPKQRAFLPRSSDGRWGWYRSLFGRQQALSFWREGDGSALDQPTLGEWLRLDINWVQFAAVVGYPVAHSWTPSEQEEFFARINSPVLAIPVTEEEWTPNTLGILREMGLVAAAVTSPLKIKSMEFVEATSSTVKELHSLNTLGWDTKTETWRGENTDLEGAEELLRSQEVTSAVAVIWGGGGTLPVLKKILPEVVRVSARRQKCEGTELPLEQLKPETVIWAVGRAHQTNWPPEHWRPTRVIDLNYGEDSPGREYALRTKAQYISGELMFRAQANGQRKFWREKCGL